MNKNIFLLTFLIEFSVGAVLVDEWAIWSPIGKTFDMVCFLNEGSKDPSLIKKGVKMVKYNRVKFTVKEQEGEEFTFDGSRCFLDQKEKMTVSRKEILGEIYSASCNFADLPFESEDMRLLGKNDYFTSLKRLVDGKIFMIPSKDCSIKKTLSAMNFVDEKAELKNKKQQEAYIKKIDKLNKHLERLESMIKSSQSEEESSFDQQVP